ncbi:MAG: winged helix-turn-helix domain-containing protein [Methylovirgula sp.]
MIGPSFLSLAERNELRVLARDGRSERRDGRRSNALVLLNDGWRRQEVVAALLVDDDTVRGWHGLYAEHNPTGVVAFNHKGSKSHLTSILTSIQETAVFEWMRATLPRDAAAIGVWIAATYGIAYSHAKLLVLLHRLGLAYRKPEIVSPRLAAAKQKAFIEAYDRLMNGLCPDEVLVFVDAIHPTHQARMVGCWAPKDAKITVAPSSGRDRVNIHGTVNLEIGETQVLDVPTVDAESTNLLLMAILAAYPTMRRSTSSSTTRPIIVRASSANGGLVGEAGSPFTELQPPPQFHRKALERHAQERHSPQILPQIPRL